MHIRCTLAVLAILWSSLAAAQVTQPLEQRIAAVRETAVGIWRIQRSEGNAAAIAKTNECRARLLKAKTMYDEEVEACLVVDYYVSMSMAAFYSQLSDEYRRANNIDVAKIRSDVGRRIQSAYAHFKLSQAEAEQAAMLLREHVFHAVAEAAATK
jgi:hypothetical protein